MVTDTAPIAGQNDEREQKSMNRETYETYSAAEPEKIDLIAFLAEYFQAFQKFFFGVLALVILAGGGSFLTAKLRGRRWPAGPGDAPWGPGPLTCTSGPFRPWAPRCEAGMDVCIRLR